MAPPPDLMPELIDEILIRISPEHPACLVRSSLVSKAWHRLLCGPAFRRRYAAFHRAPPLLGFLHNCSVSSRGKHYTGPRFVSTTKPSPLHPEAVLHNHGWRVVDCRHGRVLLMEASDPYRHPRNGSMELAVWDSATGKQTQLPKSPLFYPRWDNFINAAVLCALRGCDQTDCHGCPFLVVVVCYNIVTMALKSHLYSSEASTWSSSAFLGHRSVTVGMRPSVLIGDHIYFVLTDKWSVAITVLKIDWGSNQLSIINVPEAHDSKANNNAVLMATEDGSLGFAAILGSKLRLWSWDVVNSEVVGGWAPCRVTELRTLIPFIDRLQIVGSAEGSAIIFVASDVGVFSLDLKSGRQRKVDKPREVFTIFPFRSFCTPVSDGSGSKLRLPLGP